MLARKNRVSSIEFPAAKDRGSRLVSTLFSGTLYPSKTNTKFSVVVSKKTAKTAVSRNRIRRRFYSALEPLTRELKTAVLVVFYPKTSVVKIPFEGLKEEIRGIFIKNNLLK